MKAEIRGKYKRNCFSHSANRCHRNSNGKTLLYDQSNAEAVWRKTLLDVALSLVRLAFRATPLKAVDEVVDPKTSRKSAIAAN